jgi:tripartite-type tricarboxylate transporter receptor subunit TctC
MAHLPSRGAGETLPALLRGDMHIAESNVAPSIGAVRAGASKAFAVTAIKEPDAEGLLEKRQIPISLSASPADFDAHVRPELDRWDRIIRGNKFRIN